MKIAYFVENYGRGGVDTFISNLLRKNLFNDKIYLIYNKNNPGITNLKKLKKIKLIKYSIFSWDEVFNKYQNNIILPFLKILYSIIFPITFLYQMIVINHHL